MDTFRCGVSVILINYTTTTDTTTALPIFTATALHFFPVIEISVLPLDQR